MYARPQKHTGETRVCTRGDKRTNAWTKLARAVLSLYQLTVATLCQLQEQQKTLSWILLIRESARRQENGEQARRLTRNTSLKWRRRQQESAEQLEPRRQARRESDRQCRQSQ